MTMMNRTFFLTLIFCSAINTTPTQPPFLGAYSVDVAVKEVVKNPKSSKSFRIDSDRFFSFFRTPRPFQSVLRCECEQIQEYSKLLREHCKSLAQAKQARKTGIITCNLSFPDEDFSCAIKLIARKVDSQLFATFTIFVPQKNDPEITQALINFCNAAVPRLSFMQKHSGKVYGTASTIGFFILVKYVKAKIDYQLQLRAERRIAAEEKLKTRSYFAGEIHHDAERIKNELMKKSSCKNCSVKNQRDTCAENNGSCNTCFEKFCAGDVDDICVLGHKLAGTIQAHSFHYECIYMWLNNPKAASYIPGYGYRKAQCPMCSPEA